CTSHGYYVSAMDSW
nr:immunoglobulin heavy chain junction region [Mus musculus]